MPYCYLKIFDFGNTKLKAATENSMIFELPSFVELNFDAKKTDQLQQEGEVSKVMQAELKVTKNNSHFISYRLYALTPFSPQFMVKISKLNIHNILTEAWFGGPLVTLSQTEIVKRKLGFFVSIYNSLKYRF